ncbi:hypothetical protein [Actinokineospora sp. NBRC 105648]|uniref:hypothetical protein n=1 Tax=Actinokineospora sp. NBRC 105648 TaxID=3032206 RepID=UPI0024A54D99|nr:hypothetical protein [Actinokineospora sp. NBRC 105648]GLZ38305.1 hypothetical protein Acsp05_19290 [Actinokineospora sp. NBRC 105648]
MDEHEVRHALRGAMDGMATPPAMNSSAVLDAAKHDQRRRRATLAGLGSAAAVAAIAAGAVLLPGLGGTDSGPAVAEGAVGTITTSPSATSRSTKPTKPTRTGTTSGTMSPGGHTQSSGPQEDLAVRLTDTLLGSVPAGLTSPPGVMGESLQGPWALRHHQATTGEGGVGWEYQAHIPVGTGDGKWGRLSAEVHHGESALDGCALTQSYWGMGGTCSLVDVDGKKVGVVTKPGVDKRLDQWAAYKHPDGTVVFLAQAKGYFAAQLPGIANEPFTVEQLARLTTEPKFTLR